RNVRRVFVGFREPLRRAGPVGGLPEDTEVAVAIRLECDALAISRPERISIPATKGEPAHRRGARKVVDPYHRVLAVVGREDDAFAIGRHARTVIRSGLKL